MPQTTRCGRDAGRDITEMEYLSNMSGSGLSKVLPISTPTDAECIAASVSLVMVACSDYYSIGHALSIVRRYGYLDYLVSK